ncbi:MAG: efflux RND transporter permease subunit [Desulfotomaculaceae bacterium]|nr:efflux RND transporter permease subunit [Desulfotomaculaceae bacterium]
MKIANFSIERPLSITMLIIALITLGFFSLPRLAVDLFPDMELPVAAIMTSYEGASPAEVEKLVSKPIESAVATVSNVEEIRSISQFGNSIVIIIFSWGTSVDNSVNDLREKVELIKGMLPDDAGSPMTLKMDPNNMPIIMLSVEGKDLVRLKTLAEDTIKPRLERISGVASASINGGKEREIKILLDRAKMESYGLSVTQVMQNIAGDNISGTAGTVDSGSSEMTIRVLGDYNTPVSLKNIRINLTGTGNTIALGDIASIEDSFKQETTITTTNGEPSLGIYVMKASDGNTVQVARKVHEEVAELNKVLPAGIKIATIMDQSIFIQNSIDSVTHHGLLGGLFAVIVLYFFLRSVRSTLVVVIVMPISIITTFAMLYFGNQTINMMSLGGLMLGLGSLVDFSVVVLESIYRYRQNGFGIIEAAKLGSAEVGSAVTASAMAQILVFLPIVFVEGLAGILFKPLALTVSFSHLAALFAALTLVPMLSSKLLHNVAPPLGVFEGKSKNPAVHFGRFLHRLNGVYGKLLRWSLGHRKRVVGFVIVMLALSLAATPLIGTEFIPEMDQGELSVNIKMPPGTKLDETRKVAESIEGLIRHEISDVDHIFTVAGGGGLATMVSGSSGEASIQVKLKPFEERQKTTTEAAEQLRRVLARVPGPEITVTSGTAFSTGSAVNISIRGDDLNVLEQLGDQVLHIVKETVGVRNAENSLDDASYELQVVVDREQASRYGLTAGQVLSAVRNSFNGQVVSRMRTGDNEVDVRLETANGLKATTDSLAHLTIVSPTGARVPVQAVARIESDKAPQQITRYTQNREVSITADIAGRDLGSINAEIQEKLGRMAVPEGYLVEFGGQAEDMAESFGSLALAMVLAILLVYMFMVAQFESLFQPFIIMFALPPTFIGVVLGLGVTGHHLSVPAFIGAIMLIGIVLNNSIVLVDYINTLRKRGYERDQAILEAGPVRLRPILMTALTTVLALLPLAFGRGEGAESSAPMAVVVAFGLTLSTLITLVFVPVVYSAFDDLGKSISGRLGNMTVIKKGSNKAANEVS